MEQTSKDALFLQHLYQQDTLYVVPEGNQLGNQPVPPSVAVVLPVASAKTPGKEEKVVEEVKVVHQKEAPTPDITWMGEATKGTYLLFEVAANEFVQLPQHPFLKKVLAAVGLGTLEVKFGNLSKAKVHNIKQIALAEKARHILVFGDDLPIENLAKLEPYRMYKLDETRFVRVDSLAAIEQSTELKGKLWEVLQKIFLQ